MIQTVNTISQQIQGELPLTYKELLASFENILLVELEQGQQIDFFSIDRLLAPYHKTHLRHQTVRVLIQEHCQSEQISTLYNRDTQTYIEAQSIANCFYFAKNDHDAMLVVSLEDLSIWEFWQDDYSVAKLSDSFDDFMGKFCLIEKDDWNVYLED